MKLKLDELIMQNGNYSGNKLQEKKAKNYLMDLVAFGSSELFSEQLLEEKWDYNTPEITFSDEKLD